MTAHPANSLHLPDGCYSPESEARTIRLGSGEISTASPHHAHAIGLSLTDLGE
jgi:hypothetical protein